MTNSLVTCLFSIIVVVMVSAQHVYATSNELPECIITTHCVRTNFKVNDLESAFKKAKKIVLDTPRTKIVEQNNSYIHAEAKTKWRRYTDDLLIKALPSQGIIQVRSESRVGIGDNGVNQKRIDDFAYRLMTEPDITS